MELSIPARALLRFSATVVEQFPPHFRRRRGSLGPRQVFLSLLAMRAFGSASYRSALEQLRLSLEHQPLWGDVPTPGALAQARRKLTGAECRAGFERIRQQFCRARSCPRETFQGMRLVAVDGTRLTLPISAALKREFGCPTNQASQPAACPQAGLVVLWDVSANQPIAWELGGYRLSERDAAMRLLEHLHVGDLLLADRGYPGAEFFRAVRDRQVHFVIRMNTTTVAIATVVRGFLAGGGHDQVVDLDGMAVRLIRDPQHPERVLATSLLDAATHPAAAILAVYTARWNLEIAIRESKDWHGLEDFHARYADGIHQEVAAIMALHYLVAEIEVDLRQRVIDRIATGEEPADAATNIPYTFNRRQVAEATVYLLFLAIARPERLQGEWEYTTRQLWKARQRKRPGRSYPRRAKSPRSITRATRPRGRKIS